MSIAYKGSPYENEFLKYKLNKSVILVGCRLNRTCCTEQVFSKRTTDNEWRLLEHFY